MTEMVRVLNEDKTVITIPARELAPGMMRVNIQGGEQGVWIKADTIKHVSKIKQPPLDPGMKNIMMRFEYVLNEVYPMSAKKWEEGFRYDEHIDREICIWIRIACVYRKITEQGILNFNQKKEVLRMLITCTSTPKDQVLFVTKLKALPKDKANDVMEMFYDKNLTNVQCLDFLVSL